MSILPSCSVGRLLHTVSGLPDGAAGAQGGRVVGGQEDGCARDPPQSFHQVRRPYCEQRQSEHRALRQPCAERMVPTAHDVALSAHATVSEEVLDPCIGMMTAILQTEETAAMLSERLIRCSTASWAAGPRCLRCQVPGATPTTDEPPAASGLSSWPELLRCAQPCNVGGDQHVHAVNDVGNERARSAVAIHTDPPTVSVLGHWDQRRLLCVGLRPP